MVVDRGWRLDPVRAGQREIEAWTAYQRRQWFGVLRANVGMIQAAYSMQRWRTFVAARRLLQARRAHADPVHDVQQAHHHLEQFYSVVAGSGQPHLEPTRAADLEIGWWLAHRGHQDREKVGVEAVIAALDALEAHVYRGDPELTRHSADLRVRAMKLHDLWFTAGADPTDSQLSDARRTLVASYTSLRDAIDERA